MPKEKYGFGDRKPGPVGAKSTKKFQAHLGPAQGGESKRARKRRIGAQQSSPLKKRRGVINH